MTVWRSAPKWTTASASASAGFAWSVTALFQAVAAAAPPRLAGVDAVGAARDVFQDQSFWWKRLAPRTVSAPSWFESLLTAAVELSRRIPREIWEWLAKILRSLFGVFTGASKGDSVAVWLLIAGVVGWSIWKLGPMIVGWLRSGAAASRKPEESTWQPLAEASDLFEQAAQALREGQYAEAIRLALLALIARLEKQGLLRYDPTRTNREYQVELRPRSELAASFGQVARIYERVWYGRAPAGRADAELAIRQCGSVINREDLAPE